MELKFKHFVILQALDVLTTYIDLTYLHLNEMNSFAFGMFQNYGLINALIAMKLIGIMVIYLIFTNIAQISNLSRFNIDGEKVKIWYLRAACLIFIIVVLNNSYQMIRVMA